ncbi:Esa1p-associated factor [Coemansia sp. RSA 2611]|nr:Esa1p-associated factor [Coemansia sp. RSA 2611]
MRESSVEKRDEREEGAPTGPEVKIPIPNALKAQLVDDWERITKDKLLVPLPRNPTVAQMLTQYQEHRRANKEKRKTARRDDDEIVDEIIDGLKVYFDKALGNILLYRFERYQYKQMLEQYPERNPAEIYGSEHLLRLFVQLPHLITHTNMDDDAVQLLKEHLGDILKYLHKFAPSLFADEYESASPAYVAVAKAT